jgi:hypothetical protein
MTTVEDMIAVTVAPKAKADRRRPTPKRTTDIFMAKTFMVAPPKIFTLETIVADAKAGF